MKKLMIPASVAQGIALVALLATGWCALEIHTLQARLDSITAQPGLARADRSGPDPADVQQRLKKLEAASPRVGEMMSAIQLHFAKLYFAAEARNWGLAQFERGEIVESLDAVTAIHPDEKGVNLAGIIDAFKQTQLTSLKDALDVKDRALFREAYQDSLLVCNGCHQSTGRPFINIMTPTQPPVSNQRWEPPDFGGK